MTTNQILINLLLYVFLPLWGIAGFVDWCCHRATKIEQNTGIKESLMHSVMGIQIAIPIVLCLVFRVNVLILLICLAALILHELVAHWDVKYAATRRTISIWEMHAHSYLATLPLYLLVIIFVINWPVFVQMVTFEWQGHMHFESITEPHGGAGYLTAYLIFMAIACVFPYCEELVRCLWYKIKSPEKLA